MPLNFGHRFLFFCASVTTLISTPLFAIDNPHTVDLTSSAPRLSKEIAALAIRATRCAENKLGTGGAEKLAIIDYSRPSTERRFWLFDLKQRRLLAEELVAHGKNTGENSATKFSNEPGSLQSSLGLFRIGDTYIGKHGQSIKLLGLEPGINDQADQRAIVIHGADYVSNDFIRLHNRLGRSFGCPALNLGVIKEVISNVSESVSYLFSYYPDQNWLESSDMLSDCVNS